MSKIFQKNLQTKDFIKANISLKNHISNHINSEKSKQSQSNCRAFTNKKIMSAKPFRNPKRGGINKKKKGRNNNPGERKKNFTSRIQNENRTSPKRTEQKKKANKKIG